MGSKKLKAIVAFGKKQVSVNDIEHGRKKCIEFMKLAAKQGVDGRQYGTPADVIPNELCGDLPVKYWSEYSWPDVEKIGHIRYHEDLEVNHVIVQIVLLDAIDTLNWKKMVKQYLILMDRNMKHWE